MWWYGPPLPTRILLCSAVKAILCTPAYSARWKEIESAMIGGIPIAVILWCAYDTEFVPNRSENRFQTWITTGLTNYYTFVHKGAFQSFESLQRKYGLERNDFYRYLQVQHYFNQNLDVVLETEETGIMKIFLSIYKSTTCSNIISRMYNAILQSKSENTLYIKEK